MLKHVLFTYKYLLQNFDPWVSSHQPCPELQSLVDLVEVFQGVGGGGLNGGGVWLPVSRANLKIKYGITDEYFENALLSNSYLKRAII